MTRSACCSLVATQRLAWFSAWPSIVPLAASAVIWFCAFWIVTWSSRSLLTRALSSKMPHGTWQWALTLGSENAAAVHSEPPAAYAMR